MGFINCKRIESTSKDSKSCDTCKMEQCITQVFDICKKMSVNTLL